MKSYKNNSRILFCAVVFFWFAQYVYIPFQTPYLTEIGTSSGMIGIIIGAYGISQMLLRLPVGVLADYRNRHKTFIIVGGLSSGLASIFRIVMQNGTGYFIANVFSGLASAMWISFMVFYMSFHPKEQHKATSQLILANNLGMLAGFIASTLFYEKAGMTVICIFSVVAGLCCALMACFLREDKDDNSHEKSGNVSVKELISVCANRRLLMFAVLALVQQGVQMSTTMSFTTQIIKNLGANTVTVGISSIIYMISAVICAKFASTKLCAKLSPKSWISLVFVTTAAYCMLVPMSSSILVICCLQVLPGMATGILLSFLTSEAMKEIPKEKKSTAMGCFQAVYALGMTVFPMVCGKIAGAGTMTSAFGLLSIFCLMAAIASRFIKSGYSKQ